MHAATWKTFMCIRPSERSQTQRLHTFHLYAILERQNHSGRKQIMGARPWWWEQGLTTKGQREGIWGDDKRSIS